HRAVIHHQRPAEDAGDRVRRLDARSGEAVDGTAGFVERGAARLREDGGTRPCNGGNDTDISSEELRRRPARFPQCAQTGQHQDGQSAVGDLSGYVTIVYARRLLLAPATLLPLLQQVRNRLLRVGEFQSAAYR